MKRYFLLSILLFSLIQSSAQSYQKLADSALHLMWDARDSVGYRKSLNLYEKTFTLYPKEVNALGYYKAAVLAAELKELDKSFLFLEKLLAINTDVNTAWSSLTSKYVQYEYKNLLSDKRWPILASKAEKLKLVFLNKLSEKQKEFESGGFSKFNFSTDKSGKEIYEQLKNFNAFDTKNEKNYSIKFKINDTLNTSFFISLPKNYNPKKQYAVLFFLHGAVQGNSLTDYQDETVLSGWNRFYTKYAGINEVIMVYPQGSKQFNWMSPDDGFFMVPAMLKEIKKAININDDKVFITGHSNGATGSFSYLMKQQSPFAGFYGFNTQPKVRTGGTFLKNILNRSYFNVSTDQDYYFPPGANDSLNVIMTDLIADYQDHRYIGWPHWFPQFDESEPLYPMIFKDIAGRKRNAFQSNIYWECDDIKYGRADWMQINALDTLNKSASWHQNINFNILKLLKYNDQDSLISIDTVLKAFKFQKKSGAVKGYFKDNQFYLETSAVQSFSVLISPEMVNMENTISIFVNGKKVLERKPVYNKQLIMSGFKDTYDRKAIWVDRFDVEF